MTKAELISQIAAETQVTKATAEQTLTAVLHSITNILKMEGRVTLPGFGAFSVSERQGRIGRNPRTGQPIEIAGGKVVKFKPGKALKEAIR